MLLAQTNTPPQSVNIVLMQLKKILMYWGPRSTTYENISIDKWSKIKVEPVTEDNYGYLDYNARLKRIQQVMRGIFYYRINCFWDGA